MNLEMLDEFCLIAQFGNLSEAAKELHITQPVLSRHLKALEDEIGLTLLDRGTMPMQLTAAGEAFLPHASTISCEYRKLSDRMTQLKNHPTKVVRLGGALSSLASPALRIAKGRLARQQIRLSIVLNPPESRTPFDLVRNHQLDACFEPHSTLVDTQGLESMSIAKEPSYILVSSGHPLANNGIITATDLEDMDFAYPISNHFHGLRKHLQGICKEHLLLGNMPKSLRPINVESLREMVLDGLEGYATMLPRSIALSCTKAQGSDYVAIPFAEEGSDYDLRMFFSSNPNEQTRKFIKALEDALTQQGDVSETSPL